MRSYLNDYSLIVANNLEEALELKNKAAANARFIAGGTDLMVLLEAGKLQTKNLIALWNIDELKKISKVENYLEIGALTTFGMIRNHALVKTHFPLLVQASKLVGALAIQNRATLGGNIVNASPAADSSVVLLSYDAMLCLKNSKTERWIPYDQFHRDYKKMDIHDDEILTKIRLPMPDKNVSTSTFYRKVGTRAAQSISKVSFAGILFKKDNILQKVRLSIGAVAPMPLRLYEVEQFIMSNQKSIENINMACEIMNRVISPIDDIRSTEKFRRKVSSNLLSYFLENNW